MISSPLPLHSSKLFRFPLQLLLSAAQIPTSAIIPSCRPEIRRRFDKKQGSGTWSLVPQHHQLHPRTSRTHAHHGRNPKKREVKLRTCSSPSHVTSYHRPPEEMFLERNTRYGFDVHRFQSRSPIQFFFSFPFIGAFFSFFFFSSRLSRPSFLPTYHNK